MQKATLGRPHNISETVFLKMAEMSQENNCPPYHSYSNHNYWIKKHPRSKYACPYCNLGSKPIHDSRVDELNGNGDNVVVKKVEVVII